MRTRQITLCAKKAKQFYLPLLGIMLSAIAAPTYSAEPKTYTVMGARECTTWTFEREKAERGSGVEKLSDIGGKSWLLGYLSAINIESREQKDILAAIDSETIFLWVDRYCFQNPNKDITNAASELFVELIKISK